MQYWGWGEDSIFDAVQRVHVPMAFGQEQSVPAGQVLTLVLQTICPTTPTMPHMRVFQDGVVQTGFLWIGLAFYDLVLGGHCWVFILLYDGLYFIYCSFCILLRL